MGFCFEMIYVLSLLSRYAASWAWDGVYGVRPFFSAVVMYYYDHDEWYL